MLNACIYTTRQTSCIYYYNSYVCISIQALEQQIDKLDGYVVIVSKERFKLSQGCDHLAILCNPRESVAMIPLSGKVYVQFVLWLQ